MTNAEKIMEKGWKFGSDMVVRMWGNSKTDSCFASWLDEEYVEPPVLDKAERKYLRAVIAPFKEAVTYIKLCEDADDGRANKKLYRILIETRKSTTYLPPFQAGTMYKGMELYHPYYVEDLKL